MGRRRHSIKIEDSIEYQREDNIHAVLTFCEQAGGRQCTYNADDNEYYINGNLLERGDIIARDQHGFLRVAKKAPSDG